MAIFDNKTNRKIKIDHESTVLGRWNSIRINGKEGVYRRLVSAYTPCHPSK